MANFSYNGAPLSNDLRVDIIVCRNIVSLENWDIANLKARYCLSNATASAILLVSVTVVGLAGQVHRQLSRNSN